MPRMVPSTTFSRESVKSAIVPLPLTVMEILAIDLGTDILPALALSREPAEPGLMNRPPRPRSEGVISRAMLVRAWGFLGPISAVLVMTGFFLTLLHGGWHPAAATGAGSPLNHTYRQATTVAWLGIVTCQIGTAFAVRTDHASLRSVGVFANRFLLGGIAVSLAFAAALIYVPALNSFFGTAPLAPDQLAIAVPFPFIVWEADEIRRWVLRRRQRRAPCGTTPSAPPAGPQ
jgi:magnesium-transporting ATPase (P-type)